MDRNRRFRIVVDRREEFAQEAFARYHRQNAVVESVVAENIGEEARYDYLESVTRNSPCGMFAAAAASEVFARHQHLTGIGGIVEYEVGLRAAVFLVTPVGEEVIAETFARGRFQEARRDNLVCVHVFDGKRNTGGCKCLKFVHESCLNANCTKNANSRKSFFVL